MAEPLASLDRRTTFFKQTRDKPQEKNRFLRQIQREGKSFAKTLSQTAPEYRIDIDAPENWSLIQTLNSKARDKLQEMGFSEPEELLPTRDELSFSYGLEDEPPFCRVGNLGEFLAVTIPKGTPVDSQITKQLYLHEISHFVTRRVIKATKQEGKKKADLKTYSAGFTRFSMSEKPLDMKNIFEGRRPKGIFEEGLSDLFALYCLDENVSIETPYNLQVPFMIAVLNKYARARNISPLVAFQRAFRAKAERDFTFQRELVNVFGIQTIRDLNNVEIEFSHIANPEDLMKVAQEGGFFEDYINLRDALNDGKPIRLGGVKGGIIKTEGATDWHPAQSVETEHKMFPHLRFEVNPALDVWKINQFISQINQLGGRDLRKEIIDAHPELAKAIEFPPDKREQVIKTYVDANYSENMEKYQDLARQMENGWAGYAETFYEAVRRIFSNTHWPDGKYVGYISISPPFPRFLDNKTFQLSADMDNQWLARSAHEMLHFVFYEYVRQRYMPSLENTIESEMNKLMEGKLKVPLWELSEVFNMIVSSHESFGDGRTDGQTRYAALTPRRDELMSLWHESNENIDTFFSRLEVK